MTSLVSAHIEALAASKIREVANAALGLPDVLPFWFGEPDRVTPGFIRDAAKRALDDGDTFYHHNLGLPALRNALAVYLSALHRPVDRERIAVTSSGVNGLMLLAQALLAPGDRVVVVTPIWPNVAQIPAILGAQVSRMPLTLEPASGRWKLDLQRLIDELKPGTRAVIINSPANPTGWVMPRSAQQHLLEHCRRIGCWIVSDEAYERLVFDTAPCAPSFLDIAQADDRLVVANTFSKAWQMTGWRLGWVVTPAALSAALAKLIEFNTSCAPGFVQQAAVVALEQGEPAVADFRAALVRARDVMIAGLRALPQVELGLPDGAMYAFFRVHGCSDSLSLAKRLVREVGLGLAPGAAFGAESEGFLRWCFAAPSERLHDGLTRLARGLRASSR